jgi:hypothetical protein
MKQAAGPVVSEPMAFEAEIAMWKAVKIQISRYFSNSSRIVSSTR